MKPTNKISNIYRELVDIIESNNFTIVKKQCYDARSGWYGTNYYVYDGETRVTDLSGNGYCFRDDLMPEYLSEIKKYLALKNLDTIEAFRAWADEYAKKENLL